VGITDPDEDKDYAGYSSWEQVYAWLAQSGQEEGGEEVQEGGDKEMRIDKDVIVEMEWHQSDPTEPFEPLTGMPVVLNKAMTDAQLRLDGPWWSAEFIAPVRIVALPHLKEIWSGTKTMLMHRDPRFVWAAGIPRSDKELMASILQKP
jgi:hypothetical protein